MRASFILRCFLLVASATAISARPVIDGPERATAERRPSPARGSRSAPHRNVEGFRILKPEDQSAEHQRERHTRLPGHGSTDEVAARDLAMLDIISRDIAQTVSDYVVRSFEEDTQLVSRGLEKRHKKKEKKPSKTQQSKPATTTQASAPKVPSKPKKKHHHVNLHKVGSVLGKIGKGLLRIFRLRSDDPELYARMFESGEILRAREDIIQELRRGIVDALDQ